MVVFPNCKINLGLHVLRKRTDGYHDIETVMYPVELNDALEFIPNEKDSLTVTGITFEQKNITDNLVYKALAIIRKYKKVPPIKIHLHKAIPSGAGLGGGSSNASFMLTALNEEFNLGFSTEDLQQIALEIGSDCPFFISNIPSLSQGRGEILTALDVDISSYYIIIVSPQVHVSTAEAYSLIKPNDSRDSLSQIIEKPITEWSKLLVNDFEEPIFKKHPILKDIKSQLYEKGALYSSMSGSGSAIYGIFNLKPNTFDLSNKYRVNIVEPC